MGLNVAILGASDAVDRYSNKAQKMLQEYQHQVFPIHPKLKEIDNVKVFASLDDLNTEIHTLTVYVRPEISTPLLDKIIKLHPQRVIFNPGAENETLAGQLEKAGIATEEACTLVLLRTGQF